MPFILTMPKLSPTMEEGTIAKWHKQQGDHVEAGDLLFEVATDKATVEYQAIDSGWLRQILIHDGQEARVNQNIAIFTENENEGFEDFLKQQKTEEKPAKAGGDIQEGDLIPQEEENQPKQPSESQRTYKQPVFIPEPPLEKSASPIRQTPGERTKASPLARKIAKEKNLDLSTVKGTGPAGRVVAKDLIHAQPNGLVAFSRNQVPKNFPGSYEEESLSPMRKVISQRLQEAKSFIPHFYVSIKVEAEPLIAIREQLQNMGIKLTFNDFITRASALTLREHPDVNSGFHSVNQSIIRFKSIDISIAVSVQGGLITPIVRHADFKNLGELSAEIKSLAARAKEGKLESHEYKGGSFTISNLGMYGVSEFIAIINPPQAAILAVSGIQSVPVVRENSIVPGHEMILTLSGDHRVIDGVAGAQFLKTLKKLLENPSCLVL